MEKYKSKVGIMTMQRIVNFGSYLQAYALKKIIEQLGHKVVFVDYKIEKPILKNTSDKDEYRKTKIRNIVLRILSDCPFLFPLLPNEVALAVKERHLYEKFYLEDLGITRKRNYCSEVDTLVIGSDEVFNCLQLNPDVGYSLELFGKDNQAEKIITYAASFGNTTYDGIKKAGKSEEISSYLSKMSALSARDDNSLTIMKKLSGNQQILHHLDPALIYDFRNEIPEENHIIADFVLVYAYRRRIQQAEAEAIRQFANEKQLKVISVGGYQPFCDDNILLSPFEVLGYFHKAQYIFTDTFHGTIFSVINHKKFVTFVREGHGKEYGNAEKLNGLLDDLGLQLRKVSDIGKIRETIEAGIDYGCVDKILASERVRTEEYLKRYL